MTGSDTAGRLINANLVSLKCLLFFFFGGMGCLVPFLPLHMLAIGLGPEEIRTISMIAPAVSILGPLIAGPLADHVAASRFKLHSPSNEKIDKSSRGRYLRVMIAVCCVFSALFYSLLLIVPAIRRIDLPRELRPSVKFSCDRNGAVVYQERCRDAVGCHRWTDEDSVGAMRLQRCNYACYPAEQLRHQPTTSEEEEVMAAAALLDVAEALSVIPLAEGVTAAAAIMREDRAPAKPHVCYNDTLGRTVCHAFTERSDAALPINVSLRQAVNPEDAHEWCAYPVAQFFDCRIPSGMASSSARQRLGCVIECQIEHPYDALEQDGVLAESQCRRVVGNEQLTFWMYLAIRSLADIFPAAAVALIDAATLVATRETSTGRGDVGRQLAFGSLGFALFGPLSGYLTTQLQPHPSYYAPLAMHAILVLLAACVALSANRMPLGPPEWWWHTRSGMLALPMSAVRKYGGETAALFVLLTLAGALCSAVNSYLPLHLMQLKANELSIGLALTVGALPALLFLWKSEHLVDYCGHSNLLITTFIVYILRFTGLSLVPNVWWALIAESLEFATLGVMWVTAILYFRHLIPRQMTTTGQALPVIAHFCIGRAIGAVIGACVDKVDRDEEVDAMRLIYQYLAISSACVATLYFAVYHGILKPRCHAQNAQPGQRQPPTIVQAMNGNGNYTPLRVYHNGMGRKGQFRY